TASPEYKTFARKAALLKGQREEMSYYASQPTGMAFQQMRYSAPPPITAVKEETYRRPVTGGEWEPVPGKTRYYQAGKLVGEAQQYLVSPPIISPSIYEQRLSHGMVGRETAITKSPSFKPSVIPKGEIRAYKGEKIGDVRDPVLLLAQKGAKTQELYTAPVVLVYYPYKFLKGVKGGLYDFPKMIVYDIPKTAITSGWQAVGKQFGPSAIIRGIQAQWSQDPSGFAAELSGTLLTTKLPKVIKTTHMRYELTTGKAVMAEKTPFQFVEGTSVPASLRTLRKLETRFAIGVHVTTARAMDVARVGRLELTAPPKHTLGGLRQQYDLGSFYVSAPGAKPRVYLGYAGILPESYQGLVKTELSLLPKKIKAVTIVSQVSPTPKQLSSVSAISTYQGLRGGELFLAPENIIRKSMESQLVAPARYSAAMGYPKGMEQFSGSYLKYLGKRQIVYYKASTGESHRIEFQAAELGATRYLPALGHKKAKIKLEPSFEPSMPIRTKAVSEYVMYSVPKVSFPSMARVSLPSAPSVPSRPSVPSIPKISTPSLPKSTLFTPPPPPPLFKLPKPEINLEALSSRLWPAKRITGYIPSFSALAFGIKGAYKKTNLSATGLEFRPITSGWKIMVKKFRGMF
ncbi:MAG: hypothetical protein QME12_08705, partial [Nanoarchaeota archaeon]|nr:hypothetical protein [Nanoarchaeota archaeon]